MRRLVVAAIAACLTMTGCATAVDGSSEADPSVVAKPETGSFATTARDIPAPTEADYRRAAWLRLSEKFPLLIDIDPAYRFGYSGGGGGTPSENAFASTYGSAIAKQLAAGELYTSGGASTGSAKSDDDAKDVSYAFVQMASKDAATAAANRAEIMKEDDATFGVKSPAKEPAAIPGYPAAVAYSKAWSAGRTFAGVVPVDRYVLAFYGDFSPEQIKSLADAAAKNLTGFQAVSKDKFNTLKTDEYGLAKLTLASDSSLGYSTTARSFLPFMYDVAAIKKTFDDNGVETIGRGGNTVLKARDAKGAQSVVRDLIATRKENLVDPVVESVQGVPGGQCVTAKDSTSSSSTSTYCAASSGSYVVEGKQTQKQQAMQAIGAGYLVIKSAR